MSDQDDGYRSGYGKPPRAWQFQPGQSGNPKGRPKGAKSRKALVRRLAGERHTIDDAGRRKDVTIAELVLIALRQQAMKGNLKAARKFQRILERYAPSAPEDAGVLALLERAVDAVEWEAEAAAFKLPHIELAPTGGADRSAIGRTGEVARDTGAPRSESASPAEPPPPPRSPERGGVWR